MGHLTEECTFQTGVLVPKGNWELLGIGLVEMLWKTVTGILNILLTVAIQFQDILHGFCTSRDMKTTSTEVKITQKLMATREEVLDEILLDVHNAYDTLYHGRCLDIIVVYDVVPCALRLLWRYFDRLLMMVRSVGYFGVPFQQQCGMTQGGDSPPKYSKW